MAALHLLQLSPWRRASLLLLGSPAVVAAAAALVPVISSPRLFNSAVGGAAIRREIVVVGAARVEATVSGVFEDLAYADHSSFDSPPAARVASSRPTPARRPTGPTG